MLIALMVLTVFISGCGTTDIVTPEVKLSRNLELSVFDNWKGILGGRDVTLDDHYYGDAEGKVGLNYRKGQEDYRVNMVASGLQPGVEYELKFLVTDTTAPGGDFIRQPIGYFTANPNGVGNLNVKNFIPDGPNFAEADEVFISIYKGGWRVLTTNGDAGGVDLEPVGSNRGE